MTRGAVDRRKLEPAPQHGPEKGRELREENDGVRGTGPSVQPWILARD